MKKRLAVPALFALFTTAASWSALAGPPQPLSVTETININAPVATVWAAIKDFDGLNKWHPGFVKDEIVKGSNNTTGAVRSLTIKDGPTFTEELLAFSEKSHSYKYRIIESPLPLQDYVSTVSVKKGEGGTTVVTWVGNFKRKNPADNPPEAESDAGAVNLIKGVYQGGLANLKKQLEGG
jgi:mxaD protein